MANYFVAALCDTSSPYCQYGEEVSLACASYFIHLHKS
jgi:hypothetical protein